MNRERGESSCSTAGLSTVGLIFIILKLTNLINWSWVWVLAPFAIQIFIAIVAFALMIWLR